MATTTEPYRHYQGQLEPQSAYDEEGLHPMELRPYQREIIASVTGALHDGGRGQVRMACGSGKTIVGLRCAEALVPAGGAVAVLVPSLTLAAQTLRAWARHGTRPLEVLAVCHDDSVADAGVRLGDLPAPTTTDPQRITAWLGRPHHARTRLVVSTYQSADRLAEAVRATRPLDLVIMDEAHHMAGRADSTSRRILSRTALPAHRRLFMTATPREDFRVPDLASVPTYSMDDQEVFGPVLGRYTFARGIAEGYLEDYRIAVIGVTNSQARRLLTAESVDYVDRPGAPSLQTAAAQVALALAYRQFGVRRALSFHPGVEASAEFARTLADALARSAPGVPAPVAGHVHGGMDQSARRRILRRLEGVGNGWAVVSSARCLGEGVDLPAVDAVLFAHAKKSAVDITQAVGRALRRHPDSSGPSTIIVPLVVPDQDGEIGDLDPGDFQILWDVVRALRAHDESLGAALDAQRTRDSVSNPGLPEKITVVLPSGISDGVLSQLKLLLVQQTTSVWWEGYNEAKAYRAAHGHLLVPADHCTESGHKLGHWLAMRRFEHRRGMLSAERVQHLDALGIVWDIYGGAFTAMLAEAEAYRAAHGHLLVPASYATPDGVNLGTWVVNQRIKARRGALPAERRAALDALGMVWEPPGSRRAAWEAGMEAARAYRAEHGHLLASRDYVAADGQALGAWLKTQRSKHSKGQLTDEEKAELDALGMVWSLTDALWQRGYAAAEDYFKEHGHLRVPHTHVTPDGVKLGSWILHQRQLRSGVKTGKQSPEDVAALDRIGMQWRITRRRAAPAPGPAADRR